MDSRLLPTTQMPKLDVYTDLNGVQSLNQEEDKHVALKKVAQQFESMFIDMMMKNMRSANAAFEKDSMFNSKETQFYRDMYDRQLALTMSQGRGIGIADTLYRQMTQNLPKSMQTDGEGNVPGVDDVHLAPLSQNKSVGDIHAGEMSAGDKHVDENRPEKGFELGQINTPDNHRSVGNGVTDWSHTLAAQAPEQSDNASSDDKLFSQRLPLASNPQEFVEKYLPLARDAAVNLGINENVLLAQAALETGWGGKVLARGDGVSSHNLFNIKAGEGWTGETVATHTLEIKNSQVISERADFRQYDSEKKSFHDYVAFIKKGERYQQALDNAGTDEQSSINYLREIHRAGYATDPNYVDKVVAVLKRVRAIVDTGNGI